MSDDPTRGPKNTMAAHAASDVESMPRDVAEGILGRAVDQVLADLFAEAGAPEPSAVDIVLFVRRRTPLVLGTADLGSSAHEVMHLGDGTAVVRTTWSAEARDELALVLAEYHDEWICEHEDPRGIPTALAHHLDRVAGAMSYEEALARLEDALEFVTPRSLREIGVAPIDLAALLTRGDKET